MNTIQKHVAQAIARDQYDFTPEGLLIKGGVLARGTYVEGVNGADWREHKNLVPDEGLIYILGAALAASTPIVNWFLAPFSGAVTPAPTWTALNFAANASEIVSGTEGYSETTRPAWTVTAPTTAEVDNLASRASFSIVTASSLSITGAGVLSNSTKGSTAGKLVSAARFTTPRVVYQDDTWECGYYVSLADA